MSTTPMDGGPLQGITEQDIADYLANTPDFFERHAELLASVRLASPHGHRAVSLQERQMDMLRERIKGLEHKIIEMIRHGQENVAIADRLHRWTRALLLTPEPAELPSRLSWHLVEGDIMRALDGAYSFVEVEEGTQVFYELSIELVIPLPGFVKRRAEARILSEAVKDLKSRAES